MANNPYGIYNQVFQRGGDMFAEALKNKWQQEQIGQMLNKAMFQTETRSFPMNPELGDLSMRGPVQQNQVPRQDYFSPENIPNLLNLIQSGGGNLVQSLAMFDQMNRPETKIIPGDPEGLLAVDMRRGQIQGPPRMLQNPMPKQTSAGTTWQPTGKREKMENRLGEWYEEVERGTGRPTGGREWRGYGTESKEPGYLNPDKLMVDLLNRFNSNEQVKRAQQMASNASIADDVLSGKNPIGDEAIKVFMARASGEVGNLSKSEQERYGGSKAIMDRIAQVINTAQSGTLTDENRKFMSDLAKSFQRSGKKVLQRMAKDYASQYSQNPIYGMDSERMFNYLLPQSARDTGTNEDGSQNIGRFRVKVK